MSKVVLSASARQNLSSLQATVRLLDQTQGRLATGRRVNSALDSPTNFFTARALDSRASDISSPLDSVANGVQVLRATDQGIGSMQKLVDTATSIARQARQASESYVSPSQVTLTGSLPIATISGSSSTRLAHPG